MLLREKQKMLIKVKKKRLTYNKAPEEVKRYQNAMPDQFPSDPECRKVWSCPLLSEGPN